MTVLHAEYGLLHTSPGVTAAHSARTPHLELPALVGYHNQGGQGLKPNVVATKVEVIACRGGVAHISEPAVRSAGSSLGSWSQRRTGDRCTVHAQLFSIGS